MAPDKQEAQRAAPARVSPTAPESKSASANVWTMLERTPGFNERLAEGQRQIAEGRSTPFRDIRRKR